MRPHVFNYETVCRTRGCGNENIPIKLPRWDGNPIFCGACSQPINAEPTAWHVPPSPEELGLAPTAEDVATQIASMTPEERAELAALIAPDNE